MLFVVGVLQQNLLVLQQPLLVLQQPLLVLPQPLQVLQQFHKSCLFCKKPTIVAQKMASFAKNLLVLHTKTC